MHDKKYYTKADVLKWKGGLIIPKNGFDEITMYDEDKDDLKERHKNIHQNIRKESDGEKFFSYYTVVRFIQKLKINFEQIPKS